MSLSNCIRISLLLPNVDVFTFGESNLFGYDSLNHCLIVISLNEINKNLNDQSIIRLHLSSLPTNPIRELILNENETILALLSDKTAFLVYLPQTINSSSQSSCLCPLSVISNNVSITNRLIDLIWLSPIHLMIVNSLPSSSECDLYIVRPLKCDGIELVRTFSVGCLTSKGRTSEISNKKISLHQPLDIVKLDLTKRKEENCSLILLFALKSNGDIYLMEIDENQLIEENQLSEICLSWSFVGPIRILPSTFDNYGADHRHSRLLCLSNSTIPIVILTREKCEINECILINPSIDEYHLFTIDSIHLPINENNQLIKSMISDRLNSNIYYIFDSLSNIYSIEINWRNQIEQKEKRISQTTIQHLIKSNYFIYQFGLIQTNNKGQWLTVITKTSNNQQKELVFLRPHCLSLPSLNPSTSISVRPSIKSNSSLEFFNRIRTILHRDQSITFSSSLTNLSDSDFQINLLEFLQIFSKEYFEKQEKVRIELDNKQRYLHDFQQTQIVANQELETKLQLIEQSFQILNKQFQQEYLRRKNLSSNLDDLLSVIETQTPVRSDGEILMHQQLTKYQIQIHSLKEKISLLKQYLSTQQFSNPNQQQISQSSMGDFQTFVQYFRNEIDQMKEQIQTIQQNK